MARVCRVGGKALLLTSAENDKIIRSCFAKVFDTSSLPEEAAGTERCINCHHNALSSLWHFKWKFLYAFFKIRACMYFLEMHRRFSLAKCWKSYYKKLQPHIMHWFNTKWLGKKFLGHPHWDKDKPSLFVQKLNVTSISRLPWDTENGSWSHQWKMGRAPMVLWV